MSGSFVTPPEVFSSLCVAAPSDPDLPRGVHLRVLPSPLIGFPLTPFGVYRVKPTVVRLGQNDVLWSDRQGRRVPANVDASGGVLFADIAPPGDGAVDIAVEVIGGIDARVSLLDRVADRVVCEKSKPPYLLGAPRVDRLRIVGRGGDVALQVWRVIPSQVLEQLMGGAAIDWLGLPLDGDRPWYAGGLGRDPAMRRVEDGAPLRLAPPDRPDGPFDALTRGDEIERIRMLEASLHNACEAMTRDAGTWPTAATVVTDEPASDDRPRQKVEVRIASSLLAQAMDPGIGRYLGLVDHLHEMPDPAQPTAYAVVGHFAWDRGQLLMDGRRLADLLGDPDPLSIRLCDHFREASGVARISDTIARSGLASSCLITLAAAVPPSDAPIMPTPDLGTSRWLAPDNGPSISFRQDFLISTPPLGALMAMGRCVGGQWETRHRLIDLPAPAAPGKRSLALLLGRTNERPPLLPRGFVSDVPVEADAQATYRFALADLFGRFGPPVDLVLPDLERPLPPVPAPQVNVVLDGPEGGVEGAASPGHLDLQVPVPSVGLLQSGSLEIVALDLSLDGVIQPPIAIASPPWEEIATVHLAMPLPELNVGQRGRSTLRAAFVDSANRRSDPVELNFGYTDRRPPLTIQTAIGIIWTSRPGPSPEVELSLTWPGSAGTRYRAYIADAKSLGINGATRGEIAAEGGRRDREKILGGREHFRLLTDPPLEENGGTVLLNERIPRSLSSVLFLRIVPSTEGGREAEFDSCGVVAVAVPTDRRPPQPRIMARADGTTATLTIEALGLDLVALAAAEPGILDAAPGPEVRFPRFRLRRASGPVSSPLYAQEVLRGDLEAAQIDGQCHFRAVVTDPYQPVPFVRYSYWAEVQMPPERRLSRGAQEIPPVDEVLPLESAQIADLPGLFSLSSAPAYVVVAPPNPPDPLADGAANANTEAGSVRAVLTAPSAPAAHPLAVAPYRLRIWEQWGGGDLVSTPDVELTAGPIEWTGAARPQATTPLPLVLHVMVIDPLGRESSLVQIAAV